MNELKQLLELDLKYLFVGAILLLVGVKFVWTLLEWLFVEKLGIETKKQRERRLSQKQLQDTANLAKQTAENLSKLEDRHIKDEKEFRENLNKHMIESKKDRKALHQTQKDLVASQSKISNSVQGLVEKFDEFKTDTVSRFDTNEEKENKRDRAKLKNSISEIYRYHHSTGQINDIELETLEDLIAEYESAGGENSFVHSLVQKEMYTWEKIERN